MLPLNTNVEGKRRFPIFSSEQASQPLFCTIPKNILPSDSNPTQTTLSSVHQPLINQLYSDPAYNIANLHTDSFTSIDKSKEDSKFGNSWKSLTDNKFPMPVHSLIDHASESNHLRPEISNQQKFNTVSGKSDWNLAQVNSIGNFENEGSKVATPNEFKDPKLTPNKDLSFSPSFTNHSKSLSLQDKIRSNPEEHSDQKEHLSADESTPKTESKKSSKIQEKFYIPAKDYPEINFVGLLIGPRGHTLKKMEMESGTKISIRGRGSVKEGKRADPNLNTGNDEELHCLISGDSMQKIKKAKRLIEKIIETSSSVPEGQNELKRQQLRELAALNGTLRDDENQPCGMCGLLGHRKYDCPEAQNLVKKLSCLTCESSDHLETECLDFAAVNDPAARFIVDNHLLTRGMLSDFSGTSTPLNGQLEHPVNASLLFSTQDVPSTVWKGEGLPGVPKDLNAMVTSLALTGIDQVITPVSANPWTPPVIQTPIPMVSPNFFPDPILSIPVQPLGIDIPLLAPQHAVNDLDSPGVEGVSFVPPSPPSHPPPPPPPPPSTSEPDLQWVSLTGPGSAEDTPHPEPASD